MKNKRLLIGAISTNSGGAISHLNIILSNFNKQNFFSEVEVHLPYKTMLQMPRVKNIKYVSNRIFEKNLLLRIIWQVFYLNIIILFKNFNCIFVTGSSHLLINKNIVTISQNLLPFIKKEVDRYFFSLFFIKLKILKFVQKISFKLSKGIIFLHKFSKKKIISEIPSINKKKNTIIGHSVNLNIRVNTLRNVDNFRLIYVSNIDYYKNQIFLIEAINNLFTEKPRLKKKLIVEFYGNFYPKALKEMNEKISSIKNGKKYFKYMGLVKKENIYKEKKNCNTISLFASSCENFSVSLLESMTIGLPILCVNLQPMKSVLGNTGFFYKYNSKKSFQNQLINMFNKKNLLKQKITKSLERSKKYDQKIMALKTYKYLNKMSLN